MIKSQRPSFKKRIAVLDVFIVWRDYDIVRLQKKLIDDAADDEKRKNDSEQAGAKLADKGRDPTQRSKGRANSMVGVVRDCARQHIALDTDLTNVRPMGGWQWNSGDRLRLRRKMADLCCLGLRDLPPFPRGRVADGSRPL